MSSTARIDGGGAALEEKEAPMVSTVREEAPMRMVVELRRCKKAETSRSGEEMTKMEGESSGGETRAVEEEVMPKSAHGKEKKTSESGGVAMEEERETMGHSGDQESSGEQTTVEEKLEIDSGEEEEPEKRSGGGGEVAEARETNGCERNEETRKFMCDVVLESGSVVREGVERLAGDDVAVEEAKPTPLVVDEPRSESGDAGNSVITGSGGVTMVIGGSGDGVESPVMMTNEGRGGNGDGDGGGGLEMEEALGGGDNLRLPVESPRVSGNLAGKRPVESASESILERTENENEIGKLTEDENQT